ncbi:hypothetical protein NTHI1209_00123 [Haemophilus influenzae]|uniref:Uncharacterized protein n=1 Tax=Haemophilus influenzae TaxID=727 RepID=A0A158T0R1_HAEIF|nr:hypothetical protein NTHI1209_00123 [Haemophilus influenzae]
MGFSPPTNNRKIFWWAEAHPTFGIGSKQAAKVRLIFQLFFLRNTHLKNHQFSLATKSKISL